MGWKRSYDNQLEVESFPKDKKPLPYEGKGESDGHLRITYKEVLMVLFFLLTLTQLFYGVSPACTVGVDDMEVHISKNLGRPGKSLRNWSSLQSLQGNLGLGFFVLDLSTLSTLPV
jgi:hypothetical protein